MGTLTTDQGGNMFKLEIITQHYYSANPFDFVKAEMIFSTTEGSSSQNGADSTPFFGAASCSLNGYGFDNTSLAIQQNSTTSYSFYVFMLEYAGRSMFRVTTNQVGDIFTYSGTQQAPSGCYITPDLNSRISKSDVGLNSVDNTSDENKPVSTAQQAALDLKANLSGPTFSGTTTVANLRNR
jgi:hypothetical protein